MTSNESRQLNYTVISAPTSSSVINQEEVHFKRSNIIAQFIFTLMTMTAGPSIIQGDISVVSQPVTVCQTIDIAQPLSNEEILQKFISKLVLETKEMARQIAGIVNKDYRDLLW